MGRGISIMAKERVVEHHSRPLSPVHPEGQRANPGRIYRSDRSTPQACIRLLAGGGDDGKGNHSLAGRRIYDEAVREAVIVVWEASDRICGKRLKAALPHLVDSMERHGHLQLDSLVRERLLTASASTLDRLLKPVRATAGSRRRRGRRKPMGRQIPVRTYNDWNRPPPGYLEIDLVAHCGGPLSGSFIHSLV